MSLQVAAPQIKAQWAWASACNLIKMTSVRPEAFPVSQRSKECCSSCAHALSLAAVGKLTAPQCSRQALWLRLHAGTGVHNIACHA